MRLRGRSSALEEHVSKEIRGQDLDETSVSKICTIGCEMLVDMRLSGGAAGSIGAPTRALSTFVPSLGTKKSLGIRLGRIARSVTATANPETACLAG